MPDWQSLLYRQAQWEGLLVAERLVAQLADKPQYTGLSIRMIHCLGRGANPKSGRTRATAT